MNKINNTKYVESNVTILDYINSDNFDKILDLIKSKALDVNKIIDNGNTAFHIACIRGKTDFMKQIIKLSKLSPDLRININLVNDDGYSGIHLYYKYGGTSTDFLDTKDICYLNSHNISLVEYLIAKIDLFEILINNMIKYDCLSNIIIAGDEWSNIITKISDHILEMTNQTQTNSMIMTNMKYMAILKKLVLTLNDDSIVYHAIYTDNMPVIDMLIDMRFNFMIQKKKITPLMTAVRYNRYDIIKHILEYMINKSDSADEIYDKMTTNKSNKTVTYYSNVYDIYKLISTGREYNDERPITESIKHGMFAILELLIDYVKIYAKLYEDKKHKKFYLTETDQYHDTYLHTALHRMIYFNTINMTNDEIKIKLDFNNNISRDVWAFLIKHTDLNYENYDGDTPAHLLFRSSMWKELGDLLEGTTIDMLTVDQYDDNIYSYITDEDKPLFMKLTKTITIPLSVKNDQEINDMFGLDHLHKLINTEQTKNVPKNYGLFYSSIFHQMLYMKYLINKHDNILVPVIQYDEKAQNNDILFNDLLYYDISPGHKMINYNIWAITSAFYSYLPHHISWVNENLYYIDPKLEHVLKSDKENDKRFIVLKINIAFDDINVTFTHANILVYDIKQKEAWRFEPFGITNMDDGYIMDMILKKYLQNVFGTIKYYDPDKYLQGLNFQLVDKEYLTSRLNIGDPRGYCLAWCIWFVDVVATYPDISVKKIMKKYITRENINKILSDEDIANVQTKAISTNRYLDFIRRYAHMLDREKNNMLRSIGVSEYNLYNITFNPDDRKKITEYFKVQ